MSKAFKVHARGVPWEAIEAGSGVERTAIRQMADLYCRAKNVVFGWTMGITHHEHGVANVQTIVNVALLRGMVACWLPAKRAVVGRVNQLVSTAGRERSGGRRL